MATVKTQTPHFEAEFSMLTGLKLALSPEYRSEYEKLVHYLEGKAIRPLMDRRANFLTIVNKKFDLNSESASAIYALAAKHGYTFNFHQKNSIEQALNANRLEKFQAVLDEKDVDARMQNLLIGQFQPKSDEETLSYIQAETKNPSKLRTEKGLRNIENEIATALFSAFMWTSLPEVEMHAYFDPHFSRNEYTNSYWDQLQTRTEELFNRDNALQVLKIDKRIISELGGYDEARKVLLNTLPHLFDSLNNYGFLAILIAEMEVGGRNVEWELASDLILYGEKFREVSLKKNYFQWEKIEKETQDYIPGIEADQARFDLVNEGFTYRDTFVLSGSNGKIENLLLVFQKNERDETVVPCPACRSEQVQGNSYSSLGVRSWECVNLLCPDRSKYNRGKRYSFKALLMQQAIHDDRNLIPVESVRRWQKDVVTDVSESDVFDMLIRHYSIFGDTIHSINFDKIEGNTLGRKIIEKRLPLDSSLSEDLHLFNRYIVPFENKARQTKNLGDGSFEVYAGDSASVLKSFPSKTFDGAVTSPPYYNAREYSQWANMYCYLYDMLKINAEVFRTLKPGAFYLYNIFDYFDNERTTVFSAMGQKRMILSAYTVHLFRGIGFELIGNIVWDKGDIEGKRGFNAGNFSPFYQAPFNCWEHILLFRKPGPSKFELSSEIFRCKPVIKMIGGKNIHGHTAPYPDELPEILISKLKAGSRVVDPFSGSLTTGRVAEQYKVNSVNIELSEDYCRLGLAKRENRTKELDLRVKA